MKKDKVIRLLRDYTSLQADQIDYKRQLDLLDRNAAYISGKLPGGGDGQPRGSAPGDPTATTAQELVDGFGSERTRLLYQYERVSEQLRKIDYMLSLFDRQTRDIVYWHYCRRWPWDKVARKVHFSTIHTKRIGYSAIEYIAKKCD